MTRKVPTKPFKKTIEAALIEQGFQKGEEYTVRVTGTVCHFTFYSARALLWAKEGVDMVMANTSKEYSNTLRQYHKCQDLNIRYEAQMAELREQLKQQTEQVETLTALLDAEETAVIVKNQEIDMLHHELRQLKLNIGTAKLLCSKFMENRPKTSKLSKLVTKILAELDSTKVRNTRRR